MVGDFICTVCGHVGRPKKVVKGYFLVELLLWFVIVPVGFAMGMLLLAMCLTMSVAYSVWRLTTSYKGCPQCSGRPMIPVGSPIGQKMLADQKEQPVSTRDMP